MEKTVIKFTTYLKSVGRYSDHTLESYNRDLNQFLIFLSQHFSYLSNDFNSIDRNHVRSWFISLKENGNTAKTIHRKAASLKAFFKYLKKEGKIESNPTIGIILPKVAKRLVTPLKKVETNLFQTRNSTDILGLRDHVMVNLLYQTGIRRSELQNLKVNNVDLGQNFILVAGKGGKQRLIPFGIELKGLLEEYLSIRKDIESMGHQGFLFLTKKGKPLYPSAINNVVNKYLSSKGIQTSGVHRLRHTFATHLLDEGADINAIKELLGHSNLNATQIYTHNSIQKLKTVYQKTHPRGNE